jgi:hypothetical protein
MKKFFSWKPSKVLLAVLLGAVLIVALIPLFRLCNFMIPWYDDYGYAKYNVSFRAYYGDTFFNALRGACFQVKESWYAWQGTFSSIFLMAMNPFAWGDELYKCGGYFLIAIFSLSLFTMMLTLCTKMFDLKKASAFCVAFATTILALEKMYFPGHGFYWYNGGVHYIGITSFLMLLVVTIVFFSDYAGIGATITEVIIGMILAITVSGGNFVTVLNGALVLAAILIYVIVKYKKRAFRLVPIYLTYAIGFVLNAKAPGNSVRAAYFTGSAMKPLDAIINSFPDGINKGKEFIDVFFIVVLLALVPIIWDGLKGSKNRFRMPLTFIVFMAGLYFATYTPGLYGIGRNDLARVWNVCKLMLHVGAVLSEIYLLGWLHTVTKGKKGRFSLDIGYWWYYVVLLAVVAATFIMGGKERYDYSSYAAFMEVHMNEAASQYEQYQERIDIIKNGGANVEVPEYTVRPWYLRQNELSEDPGAQPNSYMAEWYGKESITLKKQ